MLTRSRARATPLRWVAAAVWLALFSVGAWYLVRPGVRVCFIRAPEGVSIELLDRNV